MKLSLATGVFMFISSPSILDLVSQQLELDMDMDTNTTIPAMGSMPTRDIMEDTILVTTMEVTVMFLKDLSPVVDISLTTETTTTKNEKSLEVVKNNIVSHVTLLNMLFCLNKC